VEPAAPAEPLRLDHADQLEAAVAALPAKYRAVLHCKYALGLNATETGRQLDMTPQNVRVCLHRAIKTLRTRMAP
jgi:RNA polymerase sigma factor (sigma-70 family)